MLTFLGDVFLDKTYDVNIKLENFIFNLEHSISPRGVPTLGKINLKQENSYIEQTFEKLPLAVCLANNHILDYGQDAFEDTLKYLDEKGIRFFGAGNEINNFNNPCIVIIGNKKIAIFGYACASTNPILETNNNYGIAELKLDKIKEDINAFKEKVDYIVLQFHWGQEEIPFPNYEDVIIARQCIDIGADLIIGHHAHVRQSVQIYNGKHIFYGIGNFIFPDLDVPINFDRLKFNSRFKKKQFRSNRKGIVVYVDEELNVQYSQFYFDKKKVYYKNSKELKWLPANKDEFNKRRKIQLRLNLIKTFLNNPKLPTLKRIRLFINIK